MENHLNEALDLDESFNFNDFHQEAGGSGDRAIPEGVQHKDATHQDSLPLGAGENPDTFRPMQNAKDESEDDMDDLFTHPITQQKNIFKDDKDKLEKVEDIETGMVDLNAPREVSLPKLGKIPMVLELEKTPSSNAYKTIANSEQKRMLMTNNFSHEGQPPMEHTPIAEVYTKRPSTVAIGAKKMKASIDSSLVTQSKAESLKFNRDETNSLKEVFCIFDKQSTGFVKEEDLLRILDIMNKDNQKVHERMQDIKENDPVANLVGKFTFDQFLKIVGKVDVEVGEDNTENTISKYENNQEELQQS